MGGKWQTVQPVSMLKQGRKFSSMLGERCRWEEIQLSIAKNGGVLQVGGGCLWRRFVIWAWLLEKGRRLGVLWERFWQDPFKAEMEFR